MQEGWRDCRWELSAHPSAETPLQPWHRKRGRKGGEALRIQKGGGKKRQEIPSHGCPAWLWECVSAGVLAAELSR